MGKLFLKLWILIVLTSVASYKIQDTVFEYVYRKNMSSNTNERLHRMYAFIEEALRPYPEAEWPARFATMQERVGAPKNFIGPTRMLRLADLTAEPGIDAEELERIRSRQTFVRPAPDHSGSEIFQVILNSDRVVVLKLPAIWNPPMFGVLTPQQFTWIVESSMYAMAVGLWLGLFWRDLKKLVRAANQVGEGKFSFHVDMRKGASLYLLADSFNKMKDRIAALLGSHKNLTNAISHEFRTPITRLRFRHELAMQAKTLAEKDHELQLMNSAIDQLDDLSTELLEYARLDREEPKLDIASIDVEPWLHELAEDAREMASATGRDVNIVILPDCEEVDGDYRYLSRAVGNLLHNAVRYAKHRVELRVGMADGKRWLHVDDDGAGIPPGDRERLFEPFTRLDSSRDRQSGGSGIGLAIVRQIVRWHGGTATISESKLGGARVSLAW